MNYSQSGNLGDLIYSLCVVKKVEHGNFYIKLNNIPNVIKKYNNGIVPVEYMNRLSQQDFEYLKPLIEAQSYIKSVNVYNNENIDMDLDDFRGVIHSKFHGNFVEAFYRTHNLKYTREEITQPWLTVPEQIGRAHV